MKIERKVSLALASALFATGFACGGGGPCGTVPGDHVVVLMPQPDVDEESFYAAACARECPDAAACEPDPVTLGDGTEVPALRCNPGISCSAGRRPRTSALAGGGGSAADWLAHTARLEADSVHAFRELAADLRRFGAPRRLVRAARRSAREERRHARTMTALSRRWGRSPGPVARIAAPPPDLVALAEHNAVEGCVRETLGAAVARWQAASATDRLVRDAMARIAEDEARHAVLSWRIDAWVRPRLSSAERQRVDAARDRAVREVLDAPNAPPMPVLGLQDQRRLARRLFAELGLIRS